MLYAAARIYVGGAPAPAGYDTLDDQYDNNLGADFHSPEELADTLSITVFEAKRVILRIQQIRARARATRRLGIHGPTPVTQVWLVLCRPQ